MNSWAPTQHKTKDWLSFSAAMKQRGSLSIWFDPETLWVPPPSGRRGGNTGSAMLRSRFAGQVRVFRAEVKPVLVELIRSPPGPSFGRASGPCSQRICNPRGGIMLLQVPGDAAAEVEDAILHKGECRRNGLRHGLRLFARAKSWSKTNVLAEVMVPPHGIKQAFRAVPSHSRLASEIIFFNSLTVSFHSCLFQRVPPPTTFRDGAESGAKVWGRCRRDEGNEQTQRCQG